LNKYLLPLAAQWRCFTEIRENVTVPEPVSHRLGHTTVEYTVVWQSVVSFVKT
jgi:hypothetical protein